MDTNSKLCSKCKHTKPRSDFAGHKRSKDGLQPWCRKCNADSQRAWLKTPQGRKYRKTKQLESYKITDELFAEMELTQNGLCAICKGPPGGIKKRLSVDHDHETGKVRGLLCHSCNVAIGLMKDNPDLLAAAIQYLSKNHPAPVAA